MTKAVLEFHGTFTKEVLLEILELASDFRLGRSIAWYFTNKDKYKAFSISEIVIKEFKP